MQTSREKYVAAKQGLARVEKTIAFVKQELLYVAAILLVLAVLYGQPANFSLGLKLVATLVCLKVIAVLGTRYATRKRDEALAVWTREVTGYEYVTVEQASHLLSGFQQEFGRSYWRYTETAEGTPVITNEGSSLVLR